MVILACDLSTNNSGLASISSDGKLNSYTNIDLHKNKDTENRIDQMIMEIDKYVNQVSPDICYVEDAWGGGSFRNVATTKKLTNIIGAVRHMCLQNGCKFKTIMPSAWRSAIGLDGGRSTKRDEFKQRSIEYVRKKYGIDAQEDAAEAICIATAAFLLETKEDTTALFE